MMEVESSRKSIGWVFRTLFLFSLISTFFATITGGLVFWYFSRDLPSIVTVEDYKPLVVTQILGRDKKGNDVVIGEFYKERRYLIPYKEIPELIIQAFISAEDTTFFEHEGINLMAIVRAAIANFKAGHVVQGGSTITQQVAKSLLLTPERSITRKIKEVIISSRIENNLSKEEILYLYLNQIYLGRGAYGIVAASKTFFDKKVDEINIGEAAMMAGMPQAPGKYSPHLNPKKAKERQLYVLRRMFENGFITHDQMKEAAAGPLKIYNEEELNHQYAAHYVEHVRRYLLDKYGEKSLYEQGITVRTPIQVELAQAAGESVKRGLREVDKRIGYRGPLKQLKNQDEIDQFLQEQRTELVKRFFRYQLLLPEGALGTLEAIDYAGFTSDTQLLKKDEVYQAVVTRVDDEKKLAEVNIGTVRAELPMDGMKWAKPVRDEKNPGWRPEPNLPSKVVSRGDVIRVRVESLAPKEGPKAMDPLAEQAVVRHKVLVSLEQEPEVQGALFSLDVKSGNVLAMVGGYDFAKSEFNRATQAERQAGSAFKPIIYAAALEKGYTPASIIVDSPIVYQDDETGKWKPTNFEEKFYGDTTFRQALIKSRNVPTIKIVQNIGVNYVIDYARRMGMTTQFPPDLSISLGSAGTNLMQLTMVYSLFPRLGKKLDPVFIYSVSDREGNTLEERLSIEGTANHADLFGPQPLMTAAAVQVTETLPESAHTAEGADPADPTKGPASLEPRNNLPNSLRTTFADPNQVLDPRVAYIMTHLTKEVVTHGTGQRAKSLGRPAAGKTGTTNDYMDAWFMGFTPNIVTGVWVGYDGHTPIGAGETGARAALPIWLSYMEKAVQSYPNGDFPVPPGITFANIHPGTGKLAAPNSQDAITEAFIAGTEPKEAYSPVRSQTDSQTDFFKEDIE